MIIGLAGIIVLVTVIYLCAMRPGVAWGILDDVASITVRAVRWLLGDRR